MNNDRIVHTVGYEVNGVVVTQRTYTWVVQVGTPKLINVAYNPGAGAPFFSAEVFEYNLTLPMGSTATAATLVKQPGDLSATIVHRSAAAGGVVTICDDCDFDRVSSPGVCLSVCLSIRLSV